MSISIARAKNEALSMAEDSHSRGCLFSPENQPEEDEHDTDKGDAETPYTLASLTACEGFTNVDDVDEGIRIVEQHIIHHFPDCK
jgi:hypothetical protein